MYTRCPQCQTTFHLTQEQLAERDGLVRCGQCTTVFRADEHLVSEPQTPILTDSVSPENNEPDEQAAAKPDLPTVRDLLHDRRRGNKTRPFFWFTGSLLLLLVLVAQYVYFYSSELAHKPELKPYIVKACDIMGCVIKSWQDVNLVELNNTIIEPHAKYDNALRIRATLINRAPIAQPFPRMEISLIDRQGQVLARRTFLPRHYLLEQEQSDTPMPPNIAIRSMLEITNPSKHTDGYEIRLLPS